MLSTAARVRANAFNYEAGEHSYRANLHAILGGYQRRTDEWIHQAHLIIPEIEQIGKQILASGIRLAIATQELRNHDLQIENAKEVDAYMRDKYTNQDLYEWTIGQISSVYQASYQLAYDVAKKAERAFRFEVGLQGSRFIQFGYWDNLKKGLLAGERLHQDLKAMEVAYLDQNKREYELSRHVSLRQLDPLALLTLKATGRCEVSIPEWLYDRDCPGHYMRRLKTVAVSLPSVVGPYTSVNCTLSLLRSTVRTSPLLKDGAYGREGLDDDRFVDYVGSVQSVVTSGASNDSGLFETNLRDERFLPFEGAGAESRWRLELPREFHPFDYATISDILLHVRYTARQGGENLGQRALTELREMLETENQSGLALLFSLRHECPTEWSAFVNGSGPFAMRLRKDHFPYMVQSETLAIDALELRAQDDNQLTDPRKVDVPADLADDLNDAGAADLNIPADNSVLKRVAAAHVFLIVRYRLE